MDIDFEEDLLDTVNDPVARCVIRYAHLTSEIASLRSHLDRAEASLRAVEDVDLPAAMDTRRQSRCEMSDGTKIEMRTDAFALIPSIGSCEKDPNLWAIRSAAFAWLAEHGHSAIVKQNLVVTFSKGEAERAEAALAKLAEERAQGRVRRVEDVNYQTLQKWLREQLAADHEVAEDVLGVHRRRWAKVSLPSKGGPL